MLNTFPHITSYRFICMEFLCSSLIKPRHTYDAVNPANTISTECLPTCFTFGQGQLCVSMSGASHLTTTLKQCHQICYHHQNYVILWSESRIPYKTWNTVLTIFLRIYFYFPPSTKLRCKFKMAPLCNYTLLSATVKVLETFLEAKFWKPFQLFRCILNYVSSITKVPSLQCWFQSKEQVKISCSHVRKVWRMLPCCYSVPC